MNCSFCEAPLPIGARYCPMCGTVVPETAEIGKSYAPFIKSAPRPGDDSAALYPPMTTSVTAAVSLVFGILAWCLLPFIGAIVAVLVGHQALEEIRQSGGRLRGNGMATTGLVLGYVQLIPVFLFVVLGLAIVLVVAIISLLALVL